jgi:fructan beta-fructosidase
MCRALLRLLVLLELLVLGLALTGCDSDPTKATQCVPAESATLVAGTAVGDRPLYHFTPPVAWMNDPAGLSWLDGEYHLFYQRDPNEIFLGDTRWGHAVSPNLLHWTDLPDALTPDAILGVPFTGSAVVTQHKDSPVCPEGVDCLVVAFTHALGEDGGQKQSIAHSVDRGRTFVQHAGNPVLTLPGSADFRDPMLRWHAPTARWTMAVGAKNQVRFYTSPDLLDWSLASVFSLPATAPQGAVECPALFPLTGPEGQTHWVLKIDVNVGLLQAGYSRYWLGSFDGNTFATESSPEGLPFDGPDFYAAQVFMNTPGSRVVWLGWLSQWSYALVTPTAGYRGAQSLPRQLALASTPAGLRLTQQPVTELAELQSDCAVYERASLAVVEETTLLAESGEAFVLTTTLQPGSAAELGLLLLQGKTDVTRLGYDSSRGVLFLDRSQSGLTDFSADFGKRVETPVALSGGQLTLQIYVDRTSIEVFAAGGLAVLSASVYPKEQRHALAAFATGGHGTLMNTRVHTMARSVR